MPTQVVGVHSSPEHTFTKQAQSSIELVAGIGVQGDAHAGATVKHSYLLRKKPEKPNLRQVHLIASELIDELRLEGFNVERGSMGENITTSGVQLTSLPHGTRLVFASGAAIELTGIRTPCKQLNGFQDGLLAPPLYTRPAVFGGLEVPEVLLSGDHKKIENWRMEQALEKTKNLRPDLLTDMDETHQ